MLFVDRSARTSSGAGAPICPASSVMWLDRAEVRVQPRRRPIDRWVLAKGIDRFPIATLDHIDSSVFVVQISPRANL
jgi:hypothetical protein